MGQEPIVYREEVVAMLFSVADIEKDVKTIVRLMEGDDGEEASEEDEL
jgi:hypothetical protein